MNRSTRGASKQRRDLINGEISNLRDLLPLPESARQRLSQLQIMSLGCVYIRKCNYLNRLFGNGRFSVDTPFDFTQAMTGFLLLATREGKLLYISDNVTEYLGHSMVDMMTQGDSIYDIIDKRDHPTVQTQLLNGDYDASSPEEKSFFCRMNVARSFRRQSGFGEHKVIHVKGYFVQPAIRDHYASQPVFMALCQPLITPDVKETLVQNNTMVFQSVHGLDMKYIEVAENGEFHLGYSSSEIYGRSWYEMIHPEDVHEAREKHVQLIKANHEIGCMVTVRVQTGCGDWIWLNMVMHIRQPFMCENGEAAIVCINQIVSEEEVDHFKLQSKLYSAHVARSPELFGEMQSSPSHAAVTITSIPLDSSEQMQSPYSNMGVQPLQYTGHFGVTIADATSSQGSGWSIGTPSMMQNHGGVPYGVMQQAEKPTEPAKICKADLLRRLKRKMTELATQCKPAKQQKLNSYDRSDHNSSGGYGTSAGYSNGGMKVEPSISGSFLADLNGMDSGTCMYGPTAVVPSTVYSSLDVSLKSKEQVVCAIPEVESMDIVDVKPDISKLILQDWDCSNPLTPESIHDVDPSDTTTSLTIDVSDSVTIPPSILTPASSPSSSPNYCVQSPIGVSTNDQMVPGASPLHVFEEETFVERAPVKPKKRLPVIDLTALEEYFDAVEHTIDNSSPSCLMSPDSMVSSSDGDNFSCFNTDVDTPSPVGSTSGEPSMVQDSNPLVNDAEMMPDLFKLLGQFMEVSQLPEVPETDNAMDMMGELMFTPLAENEDSSLLDDVLAVVDAQSGTTPSIGDNVSDLYHFSTALQMPSNGILSQSCNNVKDL